jgi:CpXC protein
MAGCENITVAVTDCAHQGGCEVSGQFWRHFDRRREDLWQSAVAGTINRIDCSKCGRRFAPPEEFLYSDTERNFAIVVSPTPLDGQVAPDDFAEVLLAVEAGLTSAALLETKALLATAADTVADPSSLKLVDIGKMLRFEDANGNTLEVAPETVAEVTEQQAEARQTLASRRARRRRRIGNSHKAAATFLAAFSQGAPDERLDDEIAQVNEAIEADYFTRDQAYAMARLARKPQAHGFDRATSFALFEEMTGISLSENLKAAKSRVGLPILAALWYAFAQLPDNARRRNGLGLEQFNLVPGKKPSGAFSSGKTASDPDKVSLSFGAINSPAFAPFLRHELAHALHDQNLKIVDDWLESQFRWKIYQLPVDAVVGQETLERAVDDWLTHLGGWNLVVPNATSEADKKLVRNMIWKACQPLDHQRPDMLLSRWKDDLAGKSGWFGASLLEEVYKQSPDNWWQNAQNWCELPSDPNRVTYMCYHYRQLIVVDKRATALVFSGVLPNKFALMSQKEFFAELYVVWHWRKNDTENKRRLLREKVPEFQLLLDLLSSPVVV